MESENFKINKSTEKNFGIVFSVVFLLLGIYFSWTSKNLIWWPFIISAIILSVTLIKPSLLKHPNIWWFKFGMLLGAIVAPIVMALVYISTIIPIGLFLRITGKDLLHIKFNSQTDSYWIQRESPMQSMKLQF